MYGCAYAWTEAKICQKLSALLLVVGYSWILNCLHFAYQYFLASIFKFDMTRIKCDETKNTPYSYWCP